MVSLWNVSLNLEILRVKKSYTCIVKPLVIWFYINWKFIKQGFVHLQHLVYTVFSCKKWQYFSTNLWFNLFVIGEEKQLFVFFKSVSVSGKFPVQFASAPLPANILRALGWTNLDFFKFRQPFKKSLLPMAGNESISLSCA